MYRCSDPAVGNINPKEQRKQGRDLVCALREAGAVSWRGGGLRSEYRIQGPEIAGREQLRVESERRPERPFAPRRKPETLAAHSWCGGTLQGGSTALVLRRAVAVM